MAFDKLVINDDDYPKNYLFDLEIAEYQNIGIIGIDEAGRGSLAGPVVIAGVIPDYANPIQGITDSKKLSAKKREQLFTEITNNHAYKYYVAIIPVEVIDYINILNATKKGMMECLEILYDDYSIAIIDAVKLKVKNKYIYSITKADLKSAAVGAASILAKVTRDRILIELAEKYKGYKLEQNKGYPTKFHREALIKIGASEFHRTTYAPVRNVLNRKIQNDFL